MSDPNITWPSVVPAIKSPESVGLITFVCNTVVSVHIDTAYGMDFGGEVTGERVAYVPAGQSFYYSVDSLMNPYIMVPSHEGDFRIELKHYAKCIEFQRDPANPDSALYPINWVRLARTCDPSYNPPEDSSPTPMYTIYLTGSLLDFCMRGIANTSIRTGEIHTVKTYAGIGYICTDTTPVPLSAIEGLYAIYKRNDPTPAKLAASCASGVNYLWGSTTAADIPMLTSIASQLLQRIAELTPNKGMCIHFEDAPAAYASLNGLSVVDGNLEIKASSSKPNWYAARTKLIGTQAPATPQPSDAAPAPVSHTSNVFGGIFKKR